MIGLDAALESSHAIWGGVQLAKTLPKEANIVIVRLRYPLGFARHLLTAVMHSAFPVAATRTSSKSPSSSPASGSRSSTGTSRTPRSRITSSSGRGCGPAEEGRCLARKRNSDVYEPPAGAARPRMNVITVSPQNRSTGGPLKDRPPPRPEYHKHEATTTLADARRRDIAVRRMFVQCGGASIRRLGRRR